MSTYLRVVHSMDSSETFYQVWRIDDRRACCDWENIKLDAGPDETIWEAIRRYAPWFEPKGENPFHKLALEPGHYYRRMVRPQLGYRGVAQDWNPGASGETSTIAIARGQLIALVAQLSRICQTVHPTNATFHVFGHDIRNLLLLACTEVESHWRGVLLANGIAGDRFTTRDYQRLKDPMKLDEYVVSFPNYPWIPAVTPFGGWGDNGRPTQDLGWYDAYNAIKHNREAEFERATLAHAFAAVTACAVLMVAQFGVELTVGPPSELRSFFHFSGTPSWQFSDAYLNPNGVMHFGALSADWSPVPFPF